MPAIGALILDGLQSTLSQMTNFILFYNFPNLKEFSDNNFKFDENDGKFSKRVENTVGKGEIAYTMSNSSFSHSVFKKLALWTHKKQGLFGKGLRLHRNIAVV